MSCDYTRSPATKCFSMQDVIPFYLPRWNCACVYISTNCTVCLSSQSCARNMDTVVSVLMYVAIGHLRGQMLWDKFNTNQWFPLIDFSPVCFPYSFFIVHLASNGVHRFVKANFQALGNHNQISRPIKCQKRQHYSWLVLRAELVASCCLDPVENWCSQVTAQKKPPKATAALLDASSAFHQQSQK